jgi:hypothetical protein
MNKEIFLNSFGLIDTQAATANIENHKLNTSEQMFKHRRNLLSCIPFSLRSNARANGFIQIEIADIKKTEYVSFDYEKYCNNSPNDEDETSSTSNAATSDDEPKSKKKPNSISTNAQHHIKPIPRIGLLSYFI